MAQLSPYLNFYGSAKEAMEFYKSVFGGDLDVQLVGETPMGGQMPDAKDKVMHASLIAEGIKLFASDMGSQETSVPSELVTLTLECSSQEEIEGLFSKLGAGGTSGHDLKEEFWGGVYGDLTDRFGVRWMFNFQKQPNPVSA
jgi:PhnB protein